MGRNNLKSKGLKSLAVLFTIYGSLLTAFSALAMDFTAHGYYRFRTETIQDADTQKTSTLTRDNSRFGLIAFNQMRLRLEPMLKVNDFLSLHSQFDILDNVVFGSETTKQLELLSPVVGTVTLPAGPGSLSMVGGEAGENKSINVRRVWMDVLTPVGKLRVGRQPSHWGLGIFQNDGNERQGDFGDTADRVMFITQYDLEDGGAISGGVVWDVAFESQFDPRITGLAGNIQGNGEDMQQYAALILYERPEFSVGMFGGVRRRDGMEGNTTTTALNALGTSVAAGHDGNTLVYFADLYARYTYGEYDFKTEAVYIGGEMSTGAALNAVPFDFYSTIAVNETGVAGGIIELNPEQDVQVIMAAIEASGAYKWGGEWNVKGGFAQGDASPLSQRITQYGFRSDYNVALLMFNVPLGTSPGLYGTNASGTSALLSGHVPITGNYVNNAYYGAVGYQHHFNISDEVKKCNDFSVGGRVITAWAHKNPVDLNFPALLGDTSFPVIRNSGKWYGVEVDLVIEAEFYDHLYGSLEGGVLIPGSAYGIKVDDAQLGARIETILNDGANLAYGGRLTLMLEF